MHSKYTENTPSEHIRPDFKCITPTSITSSSSLLHNLITIGRFAHNIANSPIPERDIILNCFNNSVGSIAPSQSADLTSLCTLRLPRMQHLIKPCYNGIVSSAIISQLADFNVAKNLKRVAILRQTWYYNRACIHIAIDILMWQGFKEACDMADAM